MKDLIMDLFSDRGYRHPFDRRVVFHVMLVLSMLGFVDAHRRKDALVKALSFSAIALLLSAYLFPHLPVLRGTQPYRYFVSFVLFAVIPASAGLGVLAEWVRSTNREGRLLSLCLLAMLAPALTAIGFDLLGREPAAGLDSSQKACAKWIAAQSNTTGRVLCEDGLLGNMLPYLAGREVIGGLISQKSAMLNGGWASVGADTLFGRDRTRQWLAADEWRRYLDLYNIAFAVSSSPKLTAQLGEMSDSCREAVVFGNLHVFALDKQPRSWVLGRQAQTEVRVTAGPNRILVENAPAGEFTLKYHYMRGLRGVDAVVLRPVKIPGDPVSFIGVQNPGGLHRIEILCDR